MKGKLGVVLWKSILKINKYHSSVIFTSILVGNFCFTLKLLFDHKNYTKILCKKIIIYL